MVNFAGVSTPFNRERCAVDRPSVSTSFKNFDFFGDTSDDYFGVTTSSNHFNFCGDTPDNLDVLGMSQTKLLSK